MTRNYAPTWEAEHNPLQARERFWVYHILCLYDRTCARAAYSWNLQHLSTSWIWRFIGDSIFAYLNWFLPVYPDALTCWTPIRMTVSCKKIVNMSFIITPSRRTISVSFISFTVVTTGTIDSQVCKIGHFSYLLVGICLLAQQKRFNPYEHRSKVFFKVHVTCF